MPGRALTIAVLALAACPAAAAADSAIVRSERSGYADISGVGCGVAASVSVPLPPTATGITIKRPQAGETTNESRFTGAAVEGASVRLTAVGDGPLVCDPEENDTPPAQREWSGRYIYDVTFRERAQVAYWPGADVRRARPATARPRTVRVPDIATMTRMRWRSFGGRTAVGYGRLRCEIPGCVGRGDRFKVVLSHPSRCGDVGDTVYYGRILFYTTRRYQLLYPIRRGALYSGGRPRCATTPVRPA
jgi:hypothetical protein